MKLVKACAIVIGFYTMCNAAGAVLTSADDMIQGEVQGARASTIESRQTSIIHIFYFYILYLVQFLISV